MMIQIYQINECAFRWKMNFRPDGSREFFLAEKLRKFIIL